MPTDTAVPWVRGIVGKVTGCGLPGGGVCVPYTGHVEATASHLGRIGAAGKVSKGDGAHCCPVPSLLCSKQAGGSAGVSGSCCQAPPTPICHPSSQLSCQVPGRWQQGGISQTIEPFSQKLPLTAPRQHRGRAHPSRLLCASCCLYADPRPAFPTPDSRPGRLCLSRLRAISLCRRRGCRKGAMCVFDENQPLALLSLVPNGP